MPSGTNTVLDGDTRAHSIQLRRCQLSKWETNTCSTLCHHLCDKQNVNKTVSNQFISRLFLFCTFFICSLFFFFGKGCKLLNNFYFLFIFSLVLEKSWNSKLLHICYELNRVQYLIKSLLNLFALENLFRLTQKVCSSNQTQLIIPIHYTNYNQFELFQIYTQSSVCNQ